MERFGVLTSATVMPRNLTDAYLSYGGRVCIYSCQWKQVIPTKCQAAGCHIQEDSDVPAFILFTQGHATFLLMCCVFLLCFVPAASNSVESSGNLISYPVKVAGNAGNPVDAGYDTFYSVLNLFVVLYI
jgi:hypothetical protein